MCLRVNIAINTIVYYIYVWIFQNGVEFEAKLFRLPAGTPGIIPWGVGRVTESGLLFSESAYFLCRSALVRNALQA